MSKDTLVEQGVLTTHKIHVTPHPNMRLKPHSSCEWPEDECVIWRYMDFTKFVYMLEHKSLFFTSIKNLDDKYEGTATRKTLSKIMQIPDKKMRDQQIIALNMIPQIAKIFYVNCWIKSNSEVATMWNSYTSIVRRISS